MDFQGTIIDLELEIWSNLGGCSGEPELDGTDHGYRFWNGTKWSQPLSYDEHPQAFMAAAASCARDSLFKHGWTLTASFCAEGLSVVILRGDEQIGGCKGTGSFDENTVSAYVLALLSEEERANEPLAWDEDHPISNSGGASSP